MARFALGERDDPGGGYIFRLRCLLAEQAILLVGLLRWRVVEPFALVAGKDSTADRMVATKCLNPKNKQKYICYFYYGGDEVRQLSLIFHDNFCIKVKYPP